MIDKTDAAKLAGLLRGGVFPQAYVYPKAKRATRDLLRRRSAFLHDGDLANTVGGLPAEPNLN